jgi:cytoskeleton protein RodZ
LNEVDSMTSEASPSSAGALLKAAREKQGLHVAALAASIKVSPRKLEALEADRHDELQGPAFTRALAQSVCRALRIDPAPVLALLPRADAHDLENVTGHLNAPFRDRGSRDDGAMMVWAQRALVVAGVGLLLAAAVTYLLPTSWWRQTAEPALTSAAGAASAVVTEVLPLAGVRPGPAPEAGALAPAASAPALPSPGVAVSPAAATVVVPTAASAVAPVTTPAPPAPAVAITHLAPPPGQASTPGSARSVVQLSVAEDSWVEVRDAQGRVLLSRTVQPGEAVGVDGAMPLRAVIGNAAATRLWLRGQPVELAPLTRDNVARVELR